MRYVLLAIALLITSLGCDSEDPDRSRPIFTNPSDDIVIDKSIINADLIAGLDPQGLDLEFGVPFRTSTYVDRGIIVSEDRFYNLPMDNVLHVHLIHDLQRGFRVLRIKITFANPYETSREAIEQCGFDFETLTLTLMADRFVRYVGGTDRFEWIGINAYLNADNLWAIAIMEIKDP